MSSKVTLSKIECKRCKHGIRFLTRTEPALVTSHCVREFIPFISSKLFHKQICFEDSFSSIDFTQIMRYPSSHELSHSEITHQNSFDCLLRRQKSYYENPSRKKWFVAQYTHNCTGKFYRRPSRSHPVIHRKVASFALSIPLFANINRDGMSLENSAKFDVNCLVFSPVHKERLHHVSLFSSIHSDTVNFR
jgi:hypothetical protein